MVERAPEKLWIEGALSPPALSVVSERLELLAMTADVVDALMSGDADRLVQVTGARFRVPVVPPPLMADALPFMRDKLNADPTEVGWSPWLIVHRSTHEAIGTVGVAGKPDDKGSVTIGYSIYSEHEGRGFATEATRSLIFWVLAQPDVLRVRATIPPWHSTSLRVAEKCGMKRAGTAWDDEVGEVLVYTIEKMPPAV